MPSQETNLVVKCITNNSLELVHMQFHNTVSAIIDNIFFEAHQSNWHSAAEQYCPGVIFSYTRDLQDPTIYYMLRNAPELKVMYKDLDDSDWKKIIFIKKRQWIPIGTAKDWIKDIKRILDLVVKTMPHSLCVQLFNTVTKSLIKNTLAQLEDETN